MNQKDAVYEAIKSLHTHEVDTDRPVVLTKQEKKVVEQQLFDGFKKGRIQYNNELPSEDKLAMYVSGLVSNWLRKDKRLNGNTNYAPRRPGSRTFTPPAGVPVPRSVTSEQLEAIQAMAGPGGEVTVFVVRRPPTESTEDEESSSDPAHGQ